MGAAYMNTQLYQVIKTNNLENMKHKKWGVWWPI